MAADLTPQEQEEMQLMCAEIDLNPPLLQARMAELLYLRRLERELRRHVPRNLHLNIVRLMMRILELRGDWLRLAVRANGEGDWQ